MTTLSDPGPRRAPAPMGQLLQEVVSSREFLTAARSTGNPEVTRRARETLCSALKAYTDALSQRALPVPYSIRDELWLLKHVPW